MTLSDTLAQIAGTDAETFAGLKSAAFAYLSGYQAALDRGIANNRLFKLADHDALPMFQPPPIPKPSWLGVAWTLALTTIILAVAIRRYRRLRLA